jgi:hypothetical protein
MKRAIALSLIMLLTVGLMLPLVPTEASNKSKSHYSNKKKKKKLKKYSRAWWRRYRAQQRRKRALLARKRALQAKKTTMYAKAKAKATPNTKNVAKSGNAAKTETVGQVVQQATTSYTGGYYRDARGGWSVTVPNGWSSRPSQDGSDSTFRVYSDGRASGSATISVAGSAAPQFNDTPNAKGQLKTLGGVPVVNLRRIVIDKMIREEGWVVNDYMKEIGGKKVFVVVAQTPAMNGQPAQTKVFYFTESGGRIMSMTTSTTADSADRIANESEKVIESLNKNAASNSAQSSTSVSMKE